VDEFDESDFEEEKVNLRGSRLKLFGMEKFKNLQDETTF
jgi:hypothetical protein